MPVVCGKANSAGCCRNPRPDGRRKFQPQSRKRFGNRESRPIDQASRLRQRGPIVCGSEGAGAIDNRPPAGPRPRRLAARPAREHDPAGLALGSASGAGRGERLYLCSQRALCQTLVAFDQPTQDHHKPGVAGNILLVGDNNHGDAALRFRSASNSITSVLVRLSRFPVGSSAMRIAGSLINARAIATRCCWPPESWFG